MPANGRRSNPSSVASDWIPKVINQAADDAYVVLPAHRSRGVVEMRVQIVDADSKPERTGEAVFHTASQRPGGIVSEAYIQTATSIGKRSSNPGPADKGMSIGAQHVVISWIKHGTQQIANHAHGLSAAIEVRCSLIPQVDLHSVP